MAITRDEPTCAAAVDVFVHEVRMIEGLRDSQQPHRLHSSDSYYHCPKCKGANRVRTSKAILEEAFLNLLGSLQPKPTYLRLFRAIVADVWRAEQATAQNIKKAAERRIEELNAQSDQLDRCFIFDRTIEKAAYPAAIAARIEQMIDDGWTKSAIDQPPSH